MTRGHEAVPEAAERHGLIQSIKDRIAESGPITFAEFMELALYSPDNGYYTSGRNPWGGGGDYITNLDLGPAFAKTITRQIVEMWEALGGGKFTLVEAGAGRGTLSLGILDALRAGAHPLYEVIDVRLVDRTRRPRDGKKTGTPLPDNVSWHTSLAEIEPIISGCILSNELIDSFPFHRVTLIDAKLFEIYTAFNGNGSTFFDLPQRPSTDALAKYIKDGGIELVEGQRTEINLNATEWIKEAGRLIKKGFVLTIDYGLPGRELYSAETGPTIHCHYRHTLNNDPYGHIGEQDITSHVDFTALAAAGAQAGLEVTGFTTQKNFLLGLGILDELQNTDELNLANIDKINANRLIKDLIMPQSMGETFKTLIQHKGIARPNLKGFSWKDMSRFLR